MHSSQSVRVFCQCTIAANFEMSLSAPNKIWKNFFFFKECAQKPYLLPSNVSEYIGYIVQYCACINVDFPETFEQI